MKKVSKTTVAKNYAQALYDAAQSKGLADIVYHDCRKLSGTFTASEIKTLNNPAWRESEKKETVREIAKALDLSEPTANFLELMAQNRRLNDFNDALEQFEHIYLKENGIMEINVECVQKLSAAQEKKLQQGLEKKLGQKTVIYYNINPEILGGLVVQYGSVRIDDSLSGKLNRLEQIMKGKA